MIAGHKNTAVTTGVTCLLVHIHQVRKKNPSSNRGIETLLLDFPGGTVVKNLPANAGDPGSIPGLGRSHMLRSN